MKWTTMLGALALALCGCKSPPAPHGVPNLAHVAPGLWRGGQPSAEGWAWLAAAGVSNVVKLNTEQEGSDAEAERLGMRVERLPITTGQQLEGGPDLRTMAEAVSKTTLPGTFVHCQHGEDRTGLVVGVRRVWVDGWKADRAYAEMKARGFHPLLKGLYDAWLRFGPPAQGKGPSR